MRGQSFLEDDEAINTISKEFDRRLNKPTLTPRYLRGLYKGCTADERLVSEWKTIEQKILNECKKAAVYNKYVRIFPKSVGIRNIKMLAYANSELIKAGFNLSMGDPFSEITLETEFTLRW